MFYKLGEVNREYLKNPEIGDVINTKIATPIIADASGRELFFLARDYCRITQISREQLLGVLGFEHDLFLEYANDAAENRRRGVVVRQSDYNDFIGGAVRDFYFIFGEFDEYGKEIPVWTGGTESHF